MIRGFFELQSVDCKVAAYDLPGILAENMVLGEFEPPSPQSPFAAAACAFVKITADKTADETAMARQAWN
jgi:hypothetical protein